MGSDVKSPSKKNTIRTPWPHPEFIDVQRKELAIDIAQILPEYFQVLQKDRKCREKKGENI